MYRWERNEFPCVPSMFWGILEIHQETGYALSCTGVKSTIIVACRRAAYKALLALGMGHFHRERGSILP